MSRDQEDLLQQDDAPLADSPGAQTSNKTGLHSSARKPSNTGPGSHAAKHKAPVDGAFGNEETREPDQRDSYIGDQAPADKGRK
jgi:hypothetical protein